jgi:hypothetical protein
VLYTRVTGAALRLPTTTAADEERSMSRLSDQGVHASHERSASHDEHHLCVRIHAEFREMPGLTLTVPQAARLFSIEATRCERILKSLVHAGLLANRGNTFASSHGGRRSA